MRRKFGMASLRNKTFNKVDILRNDIKEAITNDGSDVTFIWEEVTGGVWNEDYETWEGGTLAEQRLTVRCIGKVYEYSVKEMEYEMIRVPVGTCIIRLPFDFDMNQINNKDDLRFEYLGKRFKVDSSFSYREYIDNQPINWVIKGEKSLD